MPNLEMYNPLDQRVMQVVDVYQVFTTSKPLVFQTVPNGRYDLSIILNGELEILDLDTMKKEIVLSHHFFDLTAKPIWLNIPTHLHCLNIKFKPTLLAYVDKYELIHRLKAIYENTIISDFKSQNQFNISEFDQLITDLFLCRKLNPTVFQVFYNLENDPADIRLKEIAGKNNISEKTLYRIVKTNTGLSPKELRRILRFNHTARDMMTRIINDPTQSISESLPIVYYDQSHFIKECKKITGHNPKQVFEMMKLPISDLMMSEK